MNTFIQIFRRFVCQCLLGILLIFSFFPRVFSQEKEVFTLLFTHDLHSHYVPFQVEKVDSGKETEGGYARLFTLISKEKGKNPSSNLLVDGGDFSIGTIYHTLFRTQAMGFRLLGAMGYDAVTLGNHEFDYTGDGLCEYLQAARNSGEPLPALTISNIDSIGNDPAGVRVRTCLNDFGASKYLIFERNGLKIGVFGLMGIHAAGTAPASGVVFTDPVKAARSMVTQLRTKDSVDLVICLSHTGTGYKQGDDWLADKVPGIDVIVSAHTHTVMNQPMRKGNTWIVSCGKYGSYLGSLSLKRDVDSAPWDIQDYKLIPVSDSVPEDSLLAVRIQQYKLEIEENYLSGMGMRMDQVLAYSAFRFDPLSDIEKNHADNTLGNLITDAFRYAVRKAEGDRYIPVDLAVVPMGTLRASLPEGDITVYDVFQTLSLGVGPDGSAGYPLVTAWITGKELRNLAEVDASLATSLTDAQLFFSGLRFSWNASRFPFNRVMDLYTETPGGQWVVVEENKLYRVVCSYYSAQMLSYIGENTMGLLSILHKNQDGTPVEDYRKNVIYKGDVTGELKEWQALAEYLSSFPVVEGKPQVPVRYQEVEYRKQSLPLKNPLYWFSGLRGWALGILGVGFLLICGLFLFLRRRICSVRKNLN